MTDAKGLFNIPTPPKRKRSRLPGMFRFWKKGNKLYFNTPEQEEMKREFEEELEQVLFYLFANNVDRERVWICPLSFTQGVSIGMAGHAGIFIREDGIYYGKSKITALDEIPV